MHIYILSDRTYLCYEVILIWFVCFLSGKASSGIFIAQGNVLVRVFK